MVKIILYLLLFLFGTSVPRSYAQWRDTEWQQISRADFERYIEWMDGTFSSRQQSIEEPYFSHVVIEQRFIRYDVMGAWVYVEQGIFLDEPYRKRMYNIFQSNDTTITTRSYRILTPIDIFVSNIPLTDLEYMKGCDSTIHMGVDGYFYGGLAEGKCDGTYAGATHTTSEFRVYPQMIVSWERGWNGTTQRWGSSRGFYYFRRIN